MVERLYDPSVWRLEGRNFQVRVAAETIDEIRAAPTRHAEELFKTFHALKAKYADRVTEDELSFWYNTTGGFDGTAHVLWLRIESDTVSWVGPFPDDPARPQGG